MPALTLNPTAVTDLHNAMSGHVERRDIPGLVTLIARGDDVHVDALGTKTVDGSGPMRRDTIFRIASITKPVSAAAAMMLVDDGRLALNDSVERWLPELANRKVLKTIASQLDDTVPAKRSINVHDLLSYTFGFGSVMAMPGTYPIQRALRDSRLGGDGPPEIQLMPGPDEYMKRLGELPLMQQPGERWLYNTAGDVLGVLIARVGQIVRHLSARATVCTARHERHCIQRSRFEARPIAGLLQLQHKKAEIRSVRRHLDQESVEQSAAVRMGFSRTRCDHR